MKKPDTPGQALWRYRGVLLVALIPVLLILAVVALVPRKSPLHYDRPTSLAQLQNHSQPTKYAIVFDAGSTGSRIHVFQFTESSSGLELLHDTFQQLKPGLSAYADDPDKAAESLKPLLETAMKTVPETLQATTPVSLKATAGLRLLPGDKSDKILAAVTSLLKQYKFKMAANAVSIMDGQDEGAFAWLTLNYLLQKLGQGPESTVSAIDLGGGSVQEAFAMSEAEAQAAPKGYSVTLKGAGSTYSVYVHSYLGYGLMAGRSKVMDQLNATAGSHPCFGKGSSTSYKYAGSEFVVKALDTQAHSEQCRAVSLQALHVGAACGAAVAECSFSGAWRGKPRATATYYVSSYFWDRALESGLITDSKASVWPTMPGAFATQAAAACGQPDVAALQAKYKDVKADAAPFFCLDLAYCHTLLTGGFQLTDKQPITLVKQITYKGNKYEASWALGAAVNDLSQ